MVWNQYGAGGAGAYEEISDNHRRFQMEARGHAETAFAAGFNVISTWNEIYDPDGVFDGQTYVCPAFGTYLVNARVYGPGASGVVQQSLVSVFINGAEYSRSTETYDPSTGYFTSRQVTAIVRMAAGNGMDIRAFTNVATTPVSPTSPPINNFSVIRLN